MTDDVLDLPTLPTFVVSWAYDRHRGWHLGAVDLDLLLEANDGEPPRRTVKPVAACGTDSGYQRHRRQREEPCPPCRAARNAAQTARRARQRTTGRPARRQETAMADIGAPQREVTFEPLPEPHRAPTEPAPAPPVEAPVEEPVGVPA